MPGFLLLFIESPSSMQFSETEKQLAKTLKESGLKWNPEEGDWFWCTEDVSHQFYLGESLPSSFFFRKGESHLFDSSMTWHLQQGGLKLDKFVWLPSWLQCRNLLTKNHCKIQLKDNLDKVEIEAFGDGKTILSSGKTDLEAVYNLLTKILMI